MGLLVTLACDDDVSAAVGCGVLCMVYRGRHRPEFPRLVSEWAVRASEAMGGVAVPAIAVIEDAADSPDMAERREYANAIQRLSSRFERIAHVILAEGFKGTAYRVISSTIVLLARPTMPTKVFGDTRSVAGWLAESSSVSTGSVEELRAFIESVRAA